MSNERQQHILEMLRQKGEVQLQQLKDFFPGVSVMTLRRDLTYMENEGYLIRTHGGAVSANRVASISGDEDAYSRRVSENIEAKLKIADKALSLAETGRSMYFDAGSTVMCLARLLPDDGFNIVTSGANTALELVKKQKTSVVSLGGLINRNTLSASGPSAMAMLDSINIDVAFMSASGFSMESGFTVSNVYESELKKKVVSRSKKVVLLMDTGKINRNMTFTFANLEAVDIWVAEGPLPPELQEQAKAMGVQVL